jgi:hypothetical protein
MTPGSKPAMAGRATTETQPGEWLTYTDPRYHFRLEYPADWQVTPRLDGPNAVGGVLSFQSKPAGDGTAYKIEIGQHLTLIEASETLLAWTDAYRQQETEFAPADIKTSIKELTEVDGLEAVFIRQRTPLGESQFTNIRQGERVWFVWSTIGDSAEERYKDIYDHMVQSLRFGRRPATPSRPAPASVTPATDATAIIQTFIAAPYRVVSVVQNPYAPYTLIVATQRADLACGDPTAPIRCTDDTTCGSIYTSPTCFFFVEPAFVAGADPATRFVATWPENPGLAALRLQTIRFVDAKTVEFEVAGADALTVITATHQLDLETGTLSSAGDSP